MGRLSTTECTYLPTYLRHGASCCAVPNALLPEGSGQRVQVSGQGCVCGMRAVCKCVVA